MDWAVGLKLLQSEMALSIMVASKVLERLDNVLISTLAEQELWGFMKANNEHPGNAQEKNNGPASVEEIPPPHVVSIGALDRAISWATIVH